MRVWRFLWGRRGLWGLLVVLVAALLVLLIWLAGRYEVSQVQSRIERDAADAGSDVRAALTRNIQSLQALQAIGSQSLSPTPNSWRIEAASLLYAHREWLRLEWRDTSLVTQSYAETPYASAVFGRMGRASAQSDVTAACNLARRQSGPAYSPSYFLPQSDGLGLEVMELCIPLAVAGRPSGYLVASYALQNILSELVGRALARGRELSFTEADGTRLAIFGSSRRTGRVFSAQQLLDLPGYTLVLRIDSWRSEPDVFPNVLTALVTLLSVALVTVLVLLGKDMTRRLRAERDLADALAFRKAMEDSLVTGLRARDLHGRITYVNPAFCQMTGFSTSELVGVSAPMPYWPPELADDYQQRQALRFAGNSLSREGFESVFVRKDGTRVAVLIIEAPLINAHGQQTGWMSAVLDVSDQRRMEELSRASLERLQASARLATVGEMASLLSHELNQPLAAISSYATGSLNLLGHSPSSAGQSEASHSANANANADMTLAMQRIGEQAERAGRIIRSVHDFVRRREHTPESVAPVALIDAVMPLVSLQAHRFHVRVRQDCSAQLPAVRCDRTMVEQVILNLARNAMQAMENVPLAERVLEITVTAATLSAGHESARRWLVFSFADRGVGIDEATAQQLFTPFFTTRSEGMGLGLSLCRTVVEQHGGALDFGPCQPRGTVFKFTLPVAHGPIASAIDDASTRPVRP